MKKIAESTYNLIYGQIGDPNLHEEGFEVAGTVLGQTVEDLENGQLFAPAMFDFTAKISLNKEQVPPMKRWVIINVRKVQ